MSPGLPLNRMTTAQKLEAIDEIWSDLRRNADQVPSPHWHADVLDARRHRLERGETQLHDWDAAKQRLRNLGQ